MHQGNRNNRLSATVLQLTKQRTNVNSHTVIIALFTSHICTSTATAVRYEPLTFFHPRSSFHTVHTFNFYSFNTSHLSFLLSRFLSLSIPFLTSCSFPSNFHSFLFFFLALIIYLPQFFNTFTFLPSVSPFLLYIYIYIYIFLTRDAIPTPTEDGGLLKFRASLNAFMTVWCTDHGST